MSPRVTKWNNPSVLQLAGDKDPVAVITTRARDLAAKAMDAGWSGPPFDPLALAHFLKIDVVPRADVAEARTVPVGERSFRIEFNPDRPKGRARYTLAHEIAHTLFPDCAEGIQYRLNRKKLGGNDWQVESLCNIAAGELLMPFGTLPGDVRTDIGIDRLLQLRRTYDVSMEALCIRMARANSAPCAAFCASALQHKGDIRYRIDYDVGSRSWQVESLRGLFLPDESSIADCNAIGFTTKGDEDWGPSSTRVHFEAVGISPYPGSLRPKVVGVVRLPGRQTGEQNRGTLTEVLGNALSPRGRDPRLIVQIVNNATPNWGGRGFAQALGRKWPNVQRAFREWTAQEGLRLGTVHVVEAEPGIDVASMVCQSGYGPSPRPRIRYSALWKGLEEIAARIEPTTSVHMPRIGTGQAGGSWIIIREIINSTLVSAGLRVTAYRPQ